MNKFIRIFVWSGATALMVLSGLLAGRGDSIVDFAWLVVDGRLQVVAARDRAIIVTLSDHVVDHERRWQAHIEKTNSLMFDCAGIVSTADAQFSWGRFRVYSGPRAISPRFSVHVLEVSVPQWLLALPLLLLIAKWYRRLCVRSARLENGQCISCGYDLRGSVDDRCSECGTVLAERENHRKLLAPV